MVMREAAKRAKPLWMSHIAYEGLDFLTEGSPCLRMLTVQIDYGRCNSIMRRP